MSFYCAKISRSTDKKGITIGFCNKRLRIKINTYLRLVKTNEHAKLFDEKYGLFLYLVTQ